jgi:hypothetical protein
MGFPWQQSFHELFFLQKHGSWAVRNLVSRDKTLCQEFLKLGAEDILRTAVKAHQSVCDYDAKTALRALGCDTEHL